VFDLLAENDSNATFIVLENDSLVHDRPYLKIATLQYSASITPVFGSNTFILNVVVVGATLFLTPILLSRDVPDALNVPPKTGL
jgi:hypothetical protein